MAERINKSVQISIRMEPDVRETLDALADLYEMKTRRPISATELIRLLIIEAGERELLKEKRRTRKSPA